MCNDNVYCIYLTSQYTVYTVCNDIGVHGSRAQAQVAIKKGTELTIRYTHMLQVQNTDMVQVSTVFECLNVDRVT